MKNINNIKHTVKNFLKLFLPNLFVRNIITKYNYHKFKNNAQNLDKPLVSKNNDVIVSLTTYSTRIESINLVIESIGLQTKRPKRIILWLDQDEFNEDDLPERLLALKKRGLEILFCENLKSYKKIVPTLMLCPQENIITIDDDYIYPKTLIAELIKTAKRNSNSTVASFIHSIKFKNGSPAPYKSWKLYSDSLLSDYTVFPVGAGGVFYPKNSLDMQATDKNLFLKLAPKADDVWLKYMTLLNDFRSVKIDANINFYNEFIQIPGSQKIGLFHENVLGGENDIQIQKIHEHFKDKINLFNS